MSQDTPTIDPFQPPSHTMPLFVVRQAIFDRDQQIWGYSLLLKSEAGNADPEQETAKLVADGFAIARTGLPEGMKFVIRFPQEQLKKLTALALPSEVAVPEIHSDIKPTKAVLAATERLKEAGYTIVVPLPFYDHFIKLADYLKVDITGRAAPEMFKITNKLKNLGKPLIADGIATRELYDLGLSMGYDLFHGPVFQQPEIISGQSLCTTTASKLQLVHQLSSEDYDVKDVARIIASDLSLSYRLLRFINSASFSLREKVKSLDHAISIIGQNPLKQWLMAVTLLECATSPLAMDLCFISLQRGRFLELLADAMANPPMHKDLMLLLGLFSKLDALLAQPMTDIVAPLPLEETVKAALTEHGGPGGAFLNLAESVENGKWGDINQLLSQYGLSSKDAAVKYNLASLWAQEIINSSVEE